MQRCGRGTSSSTVFFMIQVNRTMKFLKFILKNKLFSAAVLLSVIGVILLSISTVYFGKEKDKLLFSETTEKETVTEILSETKPQETEASSQTATTVTETAAEKKYNIKVVQAKKLKLRKEWETDGVYYDIDIKKPRLQGAEGTEAEKINREIDEIYEDTFNLDGGMYGKDINVRKYQYELQSKGNVQTLYIKEYFAWYGTELWGGKTYSYTFNTETGKVLTNKEYLSLYGVSSQKLISAANAYVENANRELAKEDDEFEGFYTRFRKISNLDKSVIFIKGDIVCLELIQEYSAPDDPFNTRAVMIEFDKSQVRG